MFLQQLLLHSEQYPNLLLFGNCNSKYYMQFLLNKIVKRVISAASFNPLEENALFLHSDEHSDDENASNNNEVMSTKLSSNKLSEDDILKSQRQEEIRLLFIDGGDYKQQIPKRLQSDLDRCNAQLKKKKTKGGDDNTSEKESDDKLIMRLDATEFEKINELYKHITTLLSTIWAVDSDSSKEARKRKKVIVIINSLSALGVWFGESQAFQLVHKLLQLSTASENRAKVCSVVSIVHTDTHSSSVVEQYKLHAQGIVSLVASDDMDAEETFYFPVAGGSKTKKQGDEESSSAQDEDEVEEKILNIAAVDFRCDIYSLRPGGKLLFNDEYYKVNSTSEDEGAMVHVKHPFIPKRQKKNKTKIDVEEDEEEDKPKIASTDSMQPVSSSGVTIKRKVGERRHITIGGEAETDHVHGAGCSHEHETTSSIKKKPTTGTTFLGAFEEREKEKHRQERMDRPMSKDDIEKQVTFKIGLTEKEKRAREALELPYMKDGLMNQSNKTPQEQRQQKQGFIIVDSDDEYEAEDPDDDLEL
ncbi:hypothetical protein C9374_002233 [Naegleria lovaniensis]|uniref:Elongator complex protein 5 n=1 Tax=Naegleria lovaniensis TaxID=51637 RepID=A0AA88GUP3_NAELO|nr:uncharacterized protein C9374_002233 [Naegleria lovaniensis]KAG2386489.1 hypothetical protein C9374_002233 [Naegleria lovaniensis]